MKLQKCNDQSCVPEYSEEDLLRAENQFLQNELELREQEHTLEIYETILDCIQKEGSVSKSLEVMFGENVSSMDNFATEIKAQYEAALEGLFNFISDIKDSISTKAIFSAQSKRAKDLLERAKKVMNKIHFPIYGNYTGMAHALRRVTLMLQHGTSYYDKYSDRSEKQTAQQTAHDIALQEKIQEGIAEALLKVLPHGFSQFLDITEDDEHSFVIHNAVDLVRDLGELSRSGHLSVETKAIKQLLKEVKERTSVDAKYFADYDDKKIDHLKMVLLQGLAKANMQKLHAIEAAIAKAESK